MLFLESKEALVPHMEPLLGESEENEYLYILKSHWQLCSIAFFVYVSLQPNRLTDTNL